MRTTLVSSDPPIWVVDDRLPAEFLQVVNEAFDAGTSPCQVVKKPNGREILARNIDFDAKDDLCQEVFRRISDLCGISSKSLAFSQFMVSEVWASGQDAHVDHVNVDDVGPTRHLSFLDLSRQSSSAAAPQRVVPTISIVVYFNAVGGLHFPGASGMKTIAAKVGRMVMFHNYDDNCRPKHKTSAEHYGIYFETLPRRLLIMGVLANHTPEFQTFQGHPGQPILAKTTEAVVYCAGTKQEPLFHDNPSYDTYKTPEQIAERRRAEGHEVLASGVPTELRLTLSVEVKESGFWGVKGHDMAGELRVAFLAVDKKMKLKQLRGHIRNELPISVNAILSLPNGQLLTEEHDDTMLEAFAGQSFPQIDDETTAKSSCCSE